MGGAKCVGKIMIGVGCCSVMAAMKLFIYIVSLPHFLLFRRETGAAAGAARPGADASSSRGSSNGSSSGSRGSSRGDSGGEGDSIDSAKETQRSLVHDVHAAAAAAAAAAAQQQRG